jgi:type I restriction enzyme M protein
MNSETKKHIDAARQVLVGVVPNPSAQIDQITYALIYKFMDDMDQLAISQGDEPSFFVGELENFAWSKLMDSRIGNQERMDIYREAFDKFSEAKELPDLFRSILRSATLPYRSPEVLRLFLEEISFFDYSHPEELGNAYEYLLSIMSSQGDAGQFRTPRDLIDFIVDVVSPDKKDKVLDPACGTGGFLISAFKKILKEYSGKSDGKSPLTPDERNSLMNNFEGYDIDPGMVRISQVNMYLHNFKNPKIYNYDSLSMDERWNDKFDVILANPPFMTPRGGSRPHSKFSIKSSRSEVLFVDYIMNHLKPNGRAGIVVPEGIIFQNSVAHRQLRKQLLDDGLYAVVSLPSGVFQPYSGVKTSILFFDNGFTKNDKRILFVDVKDIGVSLGATKTPTNKNDLISALSAIERFREGDEIEQSKLCFSINKSDIHESTYDLSLSKHRKKTITDFDKKLVSLRDVCNITKGKSSSTKTSPGDYRLILTAAVMKTASHYDFEGEGVCVPIISATGHGKASIKRIHFVEGKFALANLLAFLEPKNTNVLNPKYLYYCLDSAKDDIALLMKGAANVTMTLGDLGDFEIPLPSLEVQLKIVEDMDSYDAIRNGARQVVDNWKPTLPADRNWEYLPIGDVCDLYNGRAFKPTEWEEGEKGGLKIIRIQNLNNPTAPYNYFSGHANENIIINNQDLLFSWSGSRGSSFGPHIWENGKAVLNQHIYKVVCKDMVIPDYLYLALKEAVKEVEENLHGGVGLVHITKGNLEKIFIPVPPLEEQREIVKDYKLEKRYLDGVLRLAEIFDDKANKKIAEVWE